MLSCASGRRRPVPPGRVRRLQGLRPGRRDVASRRLFPGISHRDRWLGDRRAAWGYCGQMGVVGRHDPSATCGCPAPIGIGGRLRDPDRPDSQQCHRRLPGQKGGPSQTCRSAAVRIKASRRSPALLGASEWALVAPGIPRYGDHARMPLPRQDAATTPRSPSRLALCALPLRGARRDLFREPSSDKGRHLGVAAAQAMVTALDVVERHGARDARQG